jgi:hypothetical protein
MDSARDQTLQERWDLLAERWSEGTQVTDATVSTVLHEGADAVLLFRWAQDPHTYGLRLNLDAPFREFGYGNEVETWDEWVDTLGPSLLAHLDTGLVENSRRTVHENHIELDLDDQWPYLDGFDYDVETPTIDNEPRLVRVRAYAVPDAAVIATVEVLPTNPQQGVMTLTGDAPARVGLDATHLACHVAASEGLTTITTDPAPHLDILGFRPAADSRLELDTSFHLEDFDAARRLTPTDT